MPRQWLVQIRRSTAAQWTAANPVLAAGEPGWESDTDQLKFGDGATAWNALPYFAGAGTALSVTDGVHTVPSVTDIDFTSGATVSSGGAGIANVAVTGGGGGTGLVSLFDTTLGVAAASIDTGGGGIAAGHGDLIVLAYLRTDEAVARSVVSATFNNDSAANYDRQFLSANSTTVSAGTSLAQTAMSFFVHGAGGGASYPGLSQWQIASYDQTTFFKLASVLNQVVDSTAGNNQAEQNAYAWRSTAAISRMAFAAPAGKNLIAGSRLAIFGTK